MSLNSFCLYLPSLDQIIDPVSLSIAAHRPVLEAAKLIAAKGAESRCISVVEGDRWLGILGEREIVGAIAEGKNLADLTVAEVMKTPTLTLNENQNPNIEKILPLLQEHQTDWLAVFNSQGEIRGMITANSILQALKPIESPAGAHQTPDDSAPSKGAENNSEKQFKCDLFQCRIQLNAAQQRIEQAINQRQLINRIDRKLRSSQQEIRAFLAALTDVVLLVHLRDNTVEIKDTPPNRFCSTHPEIIAETTRKLSETSQNEHFIRPIRRALEFQEVVSFEYSLKTKDGAFWFSAKISRICEETVVWVAQDITQRKRAELALQELTAALEHRVNQRTAELQKVNTNLREVLREREIAERQLRDSEEKFRQLAESIREVFFIWSLDGFELLYVSPAFEQIWGISPASLYENPRLWIDTIHPQDREKVEESLLEEFQQGNFNQEFRIIRPDGDVRWIWTRSFPVHNDSGKVYRIVGLAEDMTDRRRMEEALQESEGQLATLADISPVGIFRTDIGGHYLYINERISEIVARPLREFIGDHWMSAIHPDDRPQVEAAWLMTRNHYQPLELEYRLNSSQGVVTWVLAQVIPDLDDWGTIKGFVGTLTDISERKQIETELQQLNQQLEGMVEQRTAQLQQTNEKLRHEIDLREEIQNQIAAKAYQQMIIADLGQKALSGMDYPLLVEKAMDRVARSLHVESARVLDVPVADPTLVAFFVENPPPDCAEGSGEANRVLEDSQAANDTASEEFQADPVERPIVFLGPEDRPRNFYGLSIAIESRTSCFGILSAYTQKERVFNPDDVYFLQTVAHILATTIERKQTENQLKTSLKEKELLLKEIHHRVKNNLLVVSNILEFQTDYTENPEVIKILQESQKRIESMALIHEKLYQSTGLDKVDFGDYIQELVNQLIESYDYNSQLVELELDVQPICLNLETAHPCGLIVNELVSNALKHAFPDNRSGTISVKLHQNSENLVCLTVSDNGVGFPENVDFRRVDSLGMELVCTLIDQLDGTIELIRDPGTTFYLTFQELQYRQRIS